MGGGILDVDDDAMTSDTDVALGGDMALIEE